MSITEPMDAEQSALNGAVLTAVNELGAPYVLGGGHAVNRHGGPGEFAGVPTWFASAEDLIWLKAFIVQRERCDWPDILNLIAAAEGRLDWRALLERFGPHWILLQSIIHLFDWTCPQHFGYVPIALR